MPERLGSIARHLRSRTDGGDRLLPDLVVEGRSVVEDRLVAHGVDSLVPECRSDSRVVIDRGQYDADTPFALAASRLHEHNRHRRSR